MLTFIPDATLDYHEFGELLEFDIQNKLEVFIEDSYYKDFTLVLVITGKGKVVKPLVQKLLSQNKYVESFTLAGYFNGQGGAFEVVLYN